VLPKLGWNPNDFENYVNRAETDTAWESYEKHKREKQPTQPEASTSQPATNSRKRTADDSASNPHKRRRSMTADEERSDGFPVLGNSVPANGNGFNDLLRTNATGPPIFMPPQSATPQSTYSASASGNVSFTQGGSGSTPSFLHGLGLESPTNVSTDPVSLSLPPPRINQTPTATVETPEDNETFDPKMEEAGKLIGFVDTVFTSDIRELICRDRYHLDNYKRVNTYCLPASLRPTLLQRSASLRGLVN